MPRELICFKYTINDIMLHYVTVKNYNVICSIIYMGTNKSTVELIRATTTQCYHTCIYISKCYCYQAKQ